MLQIQAPLLCIFQQRTPVDITAQRPRIANYPHRMTTACECHVHAARVSYKSNTCPRPIFEPREHKFSQTTNRYTASTENMKDNTEPRPMMLGETRRYEPDLDVDLIGTMSRPEHMI